MLHLTYPHFGLTFLLFTVLARYTTKPAPVTIHCTHSISVCLVFKNKIKTLEDEKSGLITALKLVSCEAGKDDETCKEVYPKKCEENGLNVQPPAKYRSKHKTKSKLTNKGSINNNVNQQTEQSGHSPVNPPNNAQANQALTIFPIRS